LEANGIPASAIPGGRGQFDVLRASVLIFSKQAAGRFPEHDEILRSIAERS